MDAIKLSKDSNETTQSMFSCPVRSVTTVLCLNCNGNRLIAAGQQNFQLFSIEKNDKIEHFHEIHDFRSGMKVSRPIVQPTDIGWSPSDEHCFASASTTGLLNIWDANQLATISQFKIHNGTINRLQFHPTNPKLLLTASQDGYAKLIDFRTINTNKVVATFRHLSEDGFRDIHINSTNSNLFAAALNDQCIVPLWDFRRSEQPFMILTTADRTLCLAWNVNEPYWLATGGRDRTIRIWNAQDNSSRQEPLFKVQSFGTVAKVSWRPTCRYHIACSTLSVDPRIHVWDVRRAYLPQASFCHHQYNIGDFLWRPNSDNLISVSRDERLVHAHISTAIKTDEIVSLFALNTTSKGHVYAVMPSIDNDYVRSLHAQIPITASSKISLKRFYSEAAMSAFVNWNETIVGKSILGFYSNNLVDNSVELFHQFSRKWTFGNGDKSLHALFYVCDINSSVAELLKRPDLHATWQIIKMIYAPYDTSSKYRISSSRNTPSTKKNNYLCDSMNAHRYHHHHHQHHHHHHQQQQQQQQHQQQNLKQKNGKLTNFDAQQQGQNDFHDELNSKKRTKSQEQIIATNSQMEIIDDADTYIVRDVLTDDIIFITPEDALNSNNSFDILAYQTPDIDVLRDGLDIATIEKLPIMNTDINTNGFESEKLLNICSDIMIIDGSEFEPAIEYNGLDENMQTSTQSTLPDGSDKFFTIDESYCPTSQSSPICFHDIIRKTIQYYVENNELQVAVYLLLTLYPVLGEQKIFELFCGAHFEWIGMYIDLLQKLRLFVNAKQVTKHCIEKQKIPLNYDSNEYDGTIILSAQSPTHKRLASNATNVNNKTFSPISKDFMCSICRIPCRGIFSFCGFCFHGGHIDHIQKWFHTNDECPSGCGHRCKDRYAQNRRSHNLLQQFNSK